MLRGPNSLSARKRGRATKVPSSPLVGSSAAIDIAPIDLGARLLQLLLGGSVQVAPAVAGPVEGGRRFADHAFQPGVVVKCENALLRNRAVEDLVARRN